MDVYRAKRQYIFTKIDEAGFSYKISLSFLFACLTGIGAIKDYQKYLEDFLKGSPKNKKDGMIILE